MKMLSIVTLAFALTSLFGAAEDAKPAVDVPLGTPIQTSGKVTTMHCCAMAGMTDTHTVVKLETAQGAIDTVDLGPTAELKSNGIEPKEGDKFAVAGRVGKINETYLIVVEKMTEPKAMTMTHMMDMKDGKNGMAMGAKMEGMDPSHSCCTVEGTVISTLKMKLDGEPEEHFVSKIQTDKGIAVVDLGCCSTLPATVKLTEGQNLAATGFVGELNGKPIIMADSCANLCHIKRAAGAAALPTK